ncbi:MAG: GspE family protein [Comamonadaceae bacterium]|nr:GspE family protein [Comamonadaceae bacterium]
MVLCVGPTGSGKTTTLHSALGHINTPERKIWTAEDPVEITQPGLRQVQVNPKIDWTFAKALRAFLRADPDVIMVGEIRDERDRADRDRGLADRPPGAVDAAHQQRAGDGDAAARHGHGPVQLRRRAAGRAGAAAGAPAVPALPPAARRRPAAEQSTNCSPTTCTRSATPTGTPARGRRAGRLDAQRFGRRRPAAPAPRAGLRAVRRHRLARPRRRSTS